jgi:cation:H+ antiporter
LVAGLYAWRLNTNAGLGTLVSSKVNQWTLLVGTLPIAFAIAAGSTDGLPLDGQQREELFLTAAQSVFAVAVLTNLAMTTREAIMLFALFFGQFLVGAVGPDDIHDEVRIVTGVLYLVLGAIFLVRSRAQVGGLMRRGIRAPYRELAQQ